MSVKNLSDHEKQKKNKETIDSARDYINKNPSFVKSDMTREEFAENSFRFLEESAEYGAEMIRKINKMRVLPTKEEE